MLRFPGLGSLPGFLSRRRRKRDGFAPAKARMHEQLEDRVLLDAAGLVANELTSVVSQSAFNAAECLQCEVRSEAADVREIVFVDAGVENSQAIAEIAEQISSDLLEVISIDSNSDGLHQIATALAGRSNISALHVVSHGRASELQLGNVTLDRAGLESRSTLLTEIGRSLADDADILLYGCDLASTHEGETFVETFARMTDADVAASSDATGNTIHGGNWELEFGVGSIETVAGFDVEIAALFESTLQLIDLSAAVVSDGTPSFDLNNDPGNDAGALNGIVRSHDTVTLDLFFNTDAGGATNPNFTVTLPEGMVWDFLPAQAAGDARSGIFDSTTGLAGGDMRTMVMYLADIPTTVSSSLSVTARALGVANGTQIENIVFQGDSDENTTPVQTTEDIDFTISSSASADLWLSLPQFRGSYTDVTGAQNGVVYSYSIGVLGSHPIRTGDDAIKGTAPLESDIDFDLVLAGISPGALLFDWGPAIGVPVALDGIVRNFEFNGTDFPWYEWLRPSGRAGEHPTAANSNIERSTPDSGDWTVTGSTTTAAGTTYNARITGANTEGTQFPTLDAAGRSLPADERWLLSGAIHVWVPIDEVIAGEDGTMGTEDDGVLMVTPLVTSFDPDDEFGVTNNYGAEIEDESNNSLTHTIVSSGIGGATKRNAELGRWTWIDGAAQWNAGDAVTSIGHQYDSLVSSGQNIGVLDLHGIVFGDKFDNSATKIVPISNYPPESTDNPSNGQWSRAFVNGGGVDEWLEEGVDYIIEFGTGGVGGDPGGWTDWNSMGDATLADDDTSTVWTTDPTDPALGGNADLVTGVRDSITKYRVRLLNPLVPGASVHVWVSMETTGRSTLDPTNNPNGDIIANFVAATADFLQADANPNNDWNTSDYDPATNLWYDEGDSGDIWTGDRITIVEASVRIDKEIIDIGSGNQFLAGGVATVQLEGTITIPGPDSGRPARDVWITDILPDGLTIVDGSSNLQVGDTYLQDPTDADSELLTVEAIEYFDGTSWSPTWSFGATGIRYDFGDVPLNTGLPTITFDVRLPLDAQNGQSWTNTATISSTDDASPESSRDASAGLVAVQVAALAAGKQVVTPLVPEDTTIVYELGLANASPDRDLSFIDAIDILPFDGDFAGSSYSGSFTNVAVTGLDPDFDIYVTTADQAALDSQDGTVDGYADPGTSSDAWYESEGTGNWAFTLDDVIAGVAGAPSMSQITAIRFVSDMLLASGESIDWEVELTPIGNVGVPSDMYTNQFAARTSPEILPLPVFSPQVTAAVVAPAIEIDKETCLDATGANCDPTNDAHWGEDTTLNVAATGTFRIKVANTGSAELEVTVTDAIPSGLVFVGGSVNASIGDVSGFPPTWSLSLPAETSAHLTFDVTSADPTTHTNQASASGVDRFGRIVNDSDPASITFDNSQFDLEVTKDDGGGSVAPGDTITYTIDFANHGPLDATDVVVRENLPTNTTFDATGSSAGWVETAPRTFDFAVGSLADGDTGSITFAVTVDDSVPDGFEAVSNSVSISGSGGTDLDTTNNQDTDSTPLDLPIGTAPDYMITKDDGLTNVTPGQRITYTLTITNAGDRDGTGVMVVDAFPNDLLTNVVAEDGGVVDVANGTVTWNVGNFAIGETRTFTVEADVAVPVPAGVDQITNQANVTDDGLNGADPTPENNADDDTDTITVTPAIEIDKETCLDATGANCDPTNDAHWGEDTTLNVAATGTFRIKVANTGSAELEVTVTDAIPSGLVFVGGSVNASIGDVSGFPPTWSLSLPAETSAHLTFDVTSADPTTHTNQASASGVDRLGRIVNDSDPASVTFVDPQFDLEVTKDDGGVSVAPGDTITYTIDFANHGPLDATDVVVRENLPTNTTFDATGSSTGWVETAPGTFDFTVGSLADGDTGSITFAVTVDNSVPDGFETVSNSVSISGSGGTDLDTTNNQDTDSTPLDLPTGTAPDYMITKDDGLTNVTPGQRITYTLTIINAGDRDGTGVMVVDAFPNDLLTNVVAEDGGVVDVANGTVTWNVGNFAIGESRTFTVEADVAVPVPAGVDQITNQANVTDDGLNGADPTPENNADDDTDTIDAAPDLSVTKTDGEVSAALGDSVVFTLQYENVGNQNATGVTLIETEPNGTSFDASNSSSGWSALAGDQWQFSIGDLAAGEQGQVTFAVTIEDAVAAGSMLSNVVTIEDDGTNGSDPDDSNNVGLEETAILLSSIEGFVFEDDNDNATFEDSESPIGGVTIELTGTDITGTPITRQTITDENGFYRFPDLPPGDFQVSQTQPTTHEDGADSSGTPGATVGNDLIQITLDAGQSALANNFGERELPLRASMISKRDLLASSNTNVN